MCALAKEERGALSKPTHCKRVPALKSKHFDVPAKAGL
jgi:hypothetical protein